MNSNLTTLVLGASQNPIRASNKMVRMLLASDISVVAIGNKVGIIGNTEILLSIPEGIEFHTVSLYLNPSNQKSWYDPILSLKPQRILFNPGAENYEFSRLARERGIHTENACGLVLLSLGNYNY